MALILFILALAYLTIAFGKESKQNCLDVGQCITCPSYEMDQDYCRTTGNKMKIECKGFSDFRSCASTSHDDQMQVLLFQAVMAVIGGMAYWGVQTRKQSNMTRFDIRKQR